MDLSVPLFAGFQAVFNAEYLVVVLNTGKAVFDAHLQLLRQGAVCGYMQRAQYHEAGTFGMGKHVVHYVLRSLAFYFISADGAECVPDPSEKQSQVFVYFGAGAHCAAWVAAAYLLFYGD